VTSNRQNIIFKHYEWQERHKSRERGYPDLAPLFKTILIPKHKHLFLVKKYIPRLVSRYIFFYQKQVPVYQRGNQNPYIEEEQTTQWSKEKVQKDQQRSTKHIKPKIE